MARAAKKKARRKTAGKTAKPAKILQPNGSALYAGGVPGNKGGESETIIGSWLKSNPAKRDKVVIFTKVGADLKQPGMKGLGCCLRHGISGRDRAALLDHLASREEPGDACEARAIHPLLSFRDLLFVRSHD